LAVSDDGNTVIGAHNEGGSILQDAFIWLNGAGITDLGSYFQVLGVPVSGWDSYHTAHKMSADAMVFGGEFGTGYGATGGFIATTM
jgi:hypothetical protein